MDQAGPGHFRGLGQACSLGDSQHSILCFFPAGRVAPRIQGAFNEASGLTWGDVAVDHRDKTTMVQGHLKRSKCDQFGAGTDVVVGLTGDELCPVAAIVRYFEVRGSRRSAFFLHPSGEVVVKAWFVGRVRRILGRTSPSMPGTASRLGLPRRRPWQGWRTSQSKPWGGGAARPTCCTFGPRKKA